MKATITIVAMALTAWAVAPHTASAQYGGPGPYAPHGAAPAYYPAMGPAAFTAQPMASPDGAYPPASGAYPPPGYGPPPGAYYGGGAPVDPGGYGQPPLDTGYAGGYVGESIAGDAGCDVCDSGVHNGLAGGLAPIFFGAEWLLWVRHGQEVPILVTTSPAGTAPANAGVLGQGAIPIFGGTRIEDGFTPGARLTAGLWLDPCREVGIGGRVFAVGTDETTFDANSPTGQPIIARPFLNITDPNNPAEAAFVVAFDDGNPLTDPRIGSLEAEVTSDLWGGDAFTSVLLTQGTGYRMDMLAGYQFYRIDEAVAVRSTSVQGEDFFNDNIPNGTTLAIEDIFDTQNEFHGGFLGAVTELQQGAFSFKAMGRVAVGNMNERVRVMGQTTVTPPPPAMGPPLPSVTFPGGVLAQGVNIGEGERDRTVVAPEADLTFGYNFNQNITFTVGYTFIYWTHVAQAGPQINRAVAPGAGGGPSVLPVLDTDFWVMGVNGGFEWRY